MIVNKNFRDNTNVFLRDGKLANSFSGAKAYALGDYGADLAKMQKVIYALLAVGGLYWLYKKKKG